MLLQFSTPFTYDIDPRDARMFVLSLEEDVITPETEREITLYFVWVQDVLASGVMPFKNHVGDPIGEPWAAFAGKNLLGGIVSTSLHGQGI